MRIRSGRISGAAFLLLTTLLGMTIGSRVVEAQAQRVRWDIIHLVAGVISEGGEASARAEDDSRITLTGSGTFVAPGGGSGASGSAKGGGTWRICNSTGTVCTSGVYEVTSLVRWDQAPGSPPPAVDTINEGEPSAGLAVLSILYSDGQRGILVVSCHLVGTPDSVFEGITASKGYVDYWNHEEAVPGVDANRTLFHVR